MINTCIMCNRVIKEGVDGCNKCRSYIKPKCPECSEFLGVMNVSWSTINSHLTRTMLFYCSGCDRNWEQDVYYTGQATDLYAKF